MATVTATFYDRAATERAVDDLTAAGIPRDDISVVMSNATRDRYFGGESNVHGANIAKGAAGGGVLGGSLGAIAGGFLLSGAAIAATGGAAVPFLIAGPIAGALAGGGAGAAVGSVIGALVGAGVPEHEAHAIERDVNGGGVIVAVRTSDVQAGTAEAILRRDGGGVAPGATPPTVRGETYERPATIDGNTRTPVI
jgi:hypothetical protein